ncbi:MAG TPA: hypothetical protein DDW52_17755 [Planctomycetaceae bacterium]|nr:hypothetical protein [Planctomycetaceae bacterium]
MCVPVTGRAREPAWFPAIRISCVDKVALQMRCRKASEHGAVDPSGTAQSDSLAYFSSHRNLRSFLGGIISAE